MQCFDCVRCSFNLLDFGIFSFLLIFSSSDFQIFLLDFGLVRAFTIFEALSLFIISSHVVLEFLFGHRHNKGLQQVCRTQHCTANIGQWNTWIKPTTKMQLPPPYLQLYLLLWLQLLHLINSHVVPPSLPYVIACSTPIVLY